MRGRRGGSRRRPGDRVFVIDLPDDGSLLVEVPQELVVAFEEALLSAGPEDLAPLLSRFGTRVERV